MQAKVREDSPEGNLMTEYKSTKHFHGRFTGISEIAVSLLDNDGR